MFHTSTTSYKWNFNLIASPYYIPGIMGSPRGSIAICIIIVSATSIHDRFFHLHTTTNFKYLPTLYSRFQYLPIHSIAFVR